jgi:hypothetical protein
MNTADIPRTDHRDEPRILRLYGALQPWFDKSKLQNGVIEPLREADLIE